MKHQRTPIELTARQLACLHWASLGKTSWETGVIMGVTERTVNYHIQLACKKLNVSGRQAAITKAIHAGLLSPLSGPPPPLPSPGIHPLAAREMSLSMPRPFLQAKPFLSTKS